MTFNSGLLRASLAALSLALCFLSLDPSGAQSGCLLDNCADQKPLAQPAAGYDDQNDTGSGGGYSGAWHNEHSWRRGPQPSGASQPGDFDFYVFSLSWSPGFCDTGGAEKARDQCRDGAGLGFVVHGLWPQYQSGFPSDCRGVRAPSWIALQSARGLYPDIGLARYEWRKHGTCSGKSPTAYFADVRRARDSVVIPQAFQNAHSAQDMTPQDIARAFIAANPRLRPGMIAVECSRHELSEVRICLSKDVRNFVPCPEVTRHSCYTRDISVAPIR